MELDVGRLAKLARLELSPAEAAALAAGCEAIAGAFGDLAAYAAGLPEAPPEVPGGLREDVVAPAPGSEVDGILRAAPRVDAASRAVIVPKGLP